MHKVSEISIKNISKIEGHTHLTVKLRGKKVEHAELRISENKRFFMQAIKGKPFAVVPPTVSRICGTCSVAHLLASTEAVEKALGVKPSSQTMVQRKLLMNGLNIRDHALHLYFFCMPDLFGKDSVLEFDGKLQKWLHDAFAVKTAGNNLCKLVGGRSVHPTLSAIGGFSAQPKKEEIPLVVSQLNEIRPKILGLIEVFYNSPFSFRRKTNHVALCTDDYSFLEGEIRSDEGACIPEINYWEHLHRVIMPYSTSTYFKFEGKPFMVGALARMNQNRGALHKDTKKDAQKFLKRFPSEDVFDNMLAQSIEILHCIDYSIELLESTDFQPEKPPQITPKAGQGVGVVEAPRGTLYYAVTLDAKGNVSNSNIVIPTAQNSINFEKDVATMVPKILSKPKHDIEHELEKLLRAYDPCMSCATHFLKVKWI
ncbi:MAG: nickel-dependent hydrogenase large subunit [Candidatus Diapherotrites archaeon]